MLSLGIFAAFAFAITSASLLLVYGSGLPFAATANSLPILVNILPLTASVFAFLFLIFAHLLCPDIVYSPYFIKDLPLPTVSVYNVIANDTAALRLSEVLLIGIPIIPSALFSISSLIPFASLPITTQ